MHHDVGWMPYCGAAPVPGELAGRWNLDPVVLGLLVIAALFTWRRAAPGLERRCLAAAVGLGFLLFVSPLCALTSALFSARSAHHVLLTAAMAPLVAAAWRGSGDDRGLVFWLPVSAVTLWVWHAPAVYEAALSSHFVYWLMQASLLGTGVGFWLAVRRASATTAIVGLLGYMVQMGLLGALLTFSTAPIYAPHAETTAAWGLTPLEDQQLAGLVMWVFGSIAYLGAALARLYQLLGKEAAVPAA